MVIATYFILRSLHTGLWLATVRAAAAAAIAE